MEERKRQISKLTFMIMFTLTFFIAEIVGGYLTDSLALIGDSYHMISDVLALCIGLTCLIVSQRSSKKNTFGWARAEILGALVNSVFLVALCFTILLEAIERLIKPQPIKEPKVLLVIGIIGLVVNLFGLLLFCNETHGHSHAPIKNDDEPDLSFYGDTIETNVEIDEHFEKRPCEMFDYREAQITTVETNGINGKDIAAKKPVKINITQNQQKSNKKSISSAQMNLRGVLLHIMGDALGSIVVIIGALVFIFCEGSWVSRVDPLLSILMVAIILSTTYPLLKQTSLILMQHVPNHISVTELSSKLSSEIEGVLGVHELHIWQLVGRKLIASLHVKCRNAQEYEILAAKTKEFFHKKGIHSTTIQPEFVENINGQEECVMPCQPSRSCEEHWCCFKKHSSTRERLTKR